MRREERGESEDEVFLPGEMGTEIVAAGSRQSHSFLFALFSFPLRTAIDAGAGLDYACRHLLQEIPE